MNGTFIQVWSEGVLELYIDGSLVAERITPKEVLDVTGPLQIGSFYYGCDCAFDDFRIYDRALTLEEVLALYGMAGSPNYFYVTNNKQFTDNDRTYFYNLSDSDFPFAQTSYQLSTTAESGTPTFEFDIEVNGQSQRIW